MNPELFAKRLKVGYPLFDAKDPDVIKAHNILAREHINSIPSYPNNFYGKGIVICGGGEKYFPSAYVTIRRLRQLNCILPIQLWYFSGEVNDEMINTLSELQVTCINATDIANQLSYPPRILRGWELKPFALVHSCFEEIIFLDADCFPVVNPDFLFYTHQYKETGSIFWPDFFPFPKDSLVWAATEVPYNSDIQFESGQLVLNKRVSWEALSLTMHFNERSDFYYQHMYGDKDTFLMAWKRLNKSYSMPSYGINYIGNCTICQHDFDGRRIFQHRHGDKWNYSAPNLVVGPDFIGEDEARASLDLLRQKWNGKV